MAAIVPARQVHAAGRRACQCQARAQLLEHLKIRKKKEEKIRTATQETWL